MSTASKTQETYKVFKNKPIRKLLVSNDVPEVLCHFQSQNTNTHTKPTGSSKSALTKKINSRTSTVKVQLENFRVPKSNQVPRENPRVTKSAQPHRENLRGPTGRTITLPSATCTRISRVSTKTSEKIDRSTTTARKTTNPTTQCNASKSTGSQRTVPNLSSLTIDCSDDYPQVLNPRSAGVEQFFKNENFANTPLSLDKKSLHGINERSSRLHAASSELDFRNLQRFRDENYLECHSAISRTKSKVSAIDLPGHKCSYRFYINDRLFPTPLNSDTKTLRCMQCHLPFDESRPVDSQNGIIQGKVNIDGEIKDVMMLLPVDKPVVIQEKRLERVVKKDVVYFGIIKLDGRGGCRPDAVSDSLALRYQRGFQWRGEESGTGNGDACDIVYV